MADIGPQSITLCTDDPRLINLIRQLNLLEDHERLEIFAHFCTYCGRREQDVNRACQCTNDE